MESKISVDKQLVSSRGTSGDLHRSYKTHTPSGTKFERPFSMEFDTDLDPMLRGSTGGFQLDWVPDDTNILRPVNEFNLMKEHQHVDSSHDALFVTEPTLQGQKRGRLIFDSGFITLPSSKRPRFNAAQGQPGPLPKQYNPYPSTVDLSDSKEIPVQGLHPRSASHLSTQRHHPTALDQRPAHSPVAELQKKPLDRYFCDLCPFYDFADFPTPENLARHRRGVHGVPEPGDNIWRCQMADCTAADKIWLRRDNFYLHLKRMHFNDNDGKVREVIDEFQESYEPRNHASFGFDEEDMVGQLDSGAGEALVSRSRLRSGKTQSIGWNVMTKDVGRINNRMALRATSSVSEDTMRQQPFTADIARQQHVMHIRHDKKVPESSASPKPSPLKGIGPINQPEGLIPKFNRNGKSGPKIRFDTLSQDRSCGEKKILLCALSKRNGMLDAAGMLRSDLTRKDEFY